MSGSPDSEFAKIFELLNAFEQLEDEQPTVPAQATVPAQQQSFKPNLPRPTFDSSRSCRKQLCSARRRRDGKTQKFLTGD